MTDASVEYGKFTGATPVPVVSAKPRYLIEAIEQTPPGGGLTTYYRITVRAQGVYASTVVWLQEVLAP
jgi:type IV pilus assembly protein PilX